MRDRGQQISYFSLGTERRIMSRDHQYKLDYYFTRGTEEFYDMPEDPQELENLLRTFAAQHLQPLKNAGDRI